MASVDLLRQRLKDKGYSLTAPRRSVFEALGGSEALFMRDLISRAKGVDRASVYRTIELFERLGIAVRLQHGFKYRLELSDLFTAHHHHVRCENCGKTTPFEEPDTFNQMVQDIARDNGFITHSHQLEISGLCQDCQRKKAA